MKPRLSRSILTGLLILFCVPLAEAGYKIDVTSQPDFAESVTKVIVVTTQCHETINCTEVEDQVVARMAMKRPAFSIVPVKLVKQELLAMGHTEYSTDLRHDLAAAFEASAILEMEVTHGQKGVYGGKGSESAASIKLVQPDGSILMFGEGSGRARNTLSSPEAIARTVILRILDKAFGW